MALWLVHVAMESGEVVRVDAPHISLHSGRDGVSAVHGDLWALYTEAETPEGAISIALARLFDKQWAPVPTQKRELGDFVVPPLAERSITLEVVRNEMAQPLLWFDEDEEVL